LVIKVKVNINSIQLRFIHNNLSYNGHPMDGALVGVGSLVVAGGEE
jgi:hypothetical protein